MVNFGRPYVGRKKFKGCGFGEGGVKFLTIFCGCHKSMTVSRKKKNYLTKEKNIKEKRALVFLHQRKKFPEKK